MCSTSFADGYRTVYARKWLSGGYCCQGSAFSDTISVLTLQTVTGGVIAQLCSSVARESSRSLARYLFLFEYFSGTRRLAGGRWWSRYFTRPWYSIFSKKYFQEWQLFLQIALFFEWNITGQLIECEWRIIRLESDGMQIPRKKTASHVTLQVYISCLFSRAWCDLDTERIRSTVVFTIKNIRNVLVLAGDFVWTKFSEFSSQTKLHQLQLVFATGQQGIDILCQIDAPILKVGLVGKTRHTSRR